MIPLGLLLILGFIALTRFALTQASKMQTVLSDAEQRVVEQQQAPAEAAPMGLAPIPPEAEDASPIVPFAEEPVLQICGLLVQVPFDRVLLVRSPQGIGAVRFDRPKDGAPVVYHWRFQSDPQGDLLGADAASGQGEVFQTIATGIDIRSRAVVKSESEQTTLQLGPLQLQWSAPNAITLPANSPLAVALTPARELSEVNAADPDLIWCSRQRQGL